MSIFGGLRSAVTGLFVQGQSLGMIADNIANVNTTGYKSVTPRFSTLVTTQATETLHSPGGVQSRVLRNVDEQGLLNASSVSTDIAISGGGFFAVNSDSDGSGSTFFTRAGSFRADKDGNLVNTAGYYLTGWPVVNDAVQQTNVISSFSVVNVADLTAEPEETTSISVGANLQAASATGDSFEIATQVFDRQGGSHTLTLQFVKQATTDQWTLNGTISNALFDDGAAGVTTTQLGTILFNADGTLQTVTANAGISALNGDDLDFTLDFDSALGTTDDQVTLTLDLGTLDAADGLTQFEGEFTPNFIEQNGRQFGSLTGVTITEDGTTTALFDNGQTRSIYQIPLVTFNNPNGLRESTGNVYSETTNSGTAIALEAGTGGAGSIAPAALEASTVDIADEFTKMIITQRAFSANTRVITTGDEMLDELVRIVR